jgi:3-phenylpropionate/trans-cinnamate dioxygenase ferredoxin subunit
VPRAPRKRRYLRGIALTVHRQEAVIADSTVTPIRLVGVDEFDKRQVAVVETPHGTLAVGISQGEPFAVSNRCRHMLASLGQGHVAEDGCLECPWHAARYDVHSGAMQRGPQGMLKPFAGIVKSTNGSRPLKRYPVKLRDGAIWLEG